MQRIGDENDYIADAELRRRLDFTDVELLAECEVDGYKASGPGGQHRNKVTSAIRLRHRPSGILVTGSESRSRHENLARVTKRLREAIALVARAPLPRELRWPESVQIDKGRLRVNEKNPAYFHAIGFALDALAECKGRLKDAAECLGVTSSSLVRFLSEHAKAWREANRIREENGQGPLKHK